MDDNQAAALASIRAWDWQGWDSDTCQGFSRWRSLNDIVNMLAMDGHPNAPNAILDLLCNGHLRACGDYLWQAYRRGQGNFRREEYEAKISTRWWKTMREAKDNFDFATGQVELAELGFGSVESYTWEWASDRFTTAGGSGDYACWSAPYSEEWFSASNIMVSLGDAENDNLARETTEAPAVQSNRGGAPRRYDSERAVAAVVFQWADDGSWQPNSKSEIKDKLAEWFAQRDKYPSDSFLKESARWLFEEFQRRSDEANNLAA